MDHDTTVYSPRAGAFFDAVFANQGALGITWQMVGCDGEIWETRADWAVAYLQLG
jgi:hypothetical protein